MRNSDITTASHKTQYRNKTGALHPFRTAVKTKKSANHEKSCENVNIFL